ncbi:MAG: hypothetical protein GX801_00570 [Fibrobacter sp.]|nr:hypothetical protein [Fibrobacter sp.]
MKPLRLITALISIGFLTACKSTKIDHDFVEMYVDLRIASKAYGDTTSLGRMVRQNILKDYHYSPEKFSKQVELLTSEPELWIDFQNLVINRLDTLKTIEVERFKQRIESQHRIEDHPQTSRPQRQIKAPHQNKNE